MEKLYDKLVALNREDYYPMHMPGHKRNTKLLQITNPYGLDITEIEGFDNLHQAEGILRRLTERTSRLYGAKNSYLLVNGSTCGILAGISAAVTREDTVLVARNSHKSVYHGAILMGLKPIYCYPPKLTDYPVNGGISACEIEKALINNKKISLVVITSPTYEGIVSNIKEIAEVVHRHHALLLVDEAHGAHFGFHEAFPQSAVTLGADLVVHSLHKTLPAFTQTAILHSNVPELDHKIKKYLSIYQSSSPSYLLMAGIDRCISLLEDNAYPLFDAYYRRLMDFYRSLENLRGMKLMDHSVLGTNGVYDLDPSKITIVLQNNQISGHQLQKRLREQYHIIMEMEAPEYVLGMTSICDTGEGFDRLAKALRSIDDELRLSGTKIPDRLEKNIKPVQFIPPQAAVESKMELVKLEQSNGRISGTFICMFPPGSPLLVPGEAIEREMIEYICKVQQLGISITGLSGRNNDEIEVICD